jgi:hypothetical protein
MKVDFVLEERREDYSNNHLCCTTMENSVFVCVIPQYKMSLPYALFF